MTEITREEVERIEDKIYKVLENIQTDIRELRNKMDTNFRWTLGIILVTWITTIGTILFHK
jgi:BMFP domain-containing protein YqiC